MPGTPAKTRQNKLDQVLRWPTPRSRNWAREFLNVAKADSNIVAVIAVGSAVRPRASSRDVDLVVICRDQNLLKETPPLEVDLRAYTGAEVEARVKAGHEMLGSSVKLGRVLFERDRLWHKLTQSFRSRLPLTVFDPCPHEGRTGLSPVD
jgi:predicted nucleotidyltransferase